jgi:hypothetical protein
MTITKTTSNIIYKLSFFVLSATLVLGFISTSRITTLDTFAQANNTTTNSDPSGTSDGSSGNTNTPKKSSGSQEGLNAFKVFKYDCAFPTDGCAKENSLTFSLLKVMFDLAPVVATLVFIWGGYLYFLGGVTGKADGRRTIEAAVIGLVVVLTAQYLVGENGLLYQTIDGGTINTGGINALIENIKSALVGLAYAIAVVVIIWGGFQYFLTSIPGQKQDGLKTVFNGVTGLIIIALADNIAKLIQGIVVPAASGDGFAVNSSGIVNFIVSVTNNFLIPISLALSVFFVVLAGYKWIFAGGDNKAKEAKDSLKNALIGLVISLLAVTIVNAIYYFTRAI